MVALACSPRPTATQSPLIYFEEDEILSYRARDLYDSRCVISNLKCRDDDIFSHTTSHLTYSNALHVILAVFQNKPLMLSLKLLAMRKVIELDLEVKDLPLQLRDKLDLIKAGEEDILARLDQLLPADFLCITFVKLKNNRPTFL